MMKADPVTVHSRLSEISRALAPFSDTAPLDAQTLLAHLSGHPRSWLMAHPEAPLEDGLLLRLGGAVDRLTGGEPLPYVLGEWEFYGLTFSVGPDVLIPRPETELLVERAIRWLESHPDRRQAVDVGTGSGCIAISLAVNVGDLVITASDLSPAALQVAEKNAARHRVAERIHFAEGDILAAAGSDTDLICANLPYIPTNTLHALPIYGREPTLALDGGPDGLALIRRLLAQARGKIAPGGLLLAEIEAGQGDLARQAASDSFPEALISIQPDLAGKDRLLEVAAVS
jgi:release factor glutamine methyltransferase